jgi:DNA-directed RNA polymerase subunit M/transcription elongation factor TFIIS
MKCPKCGSENVTVTLEQVSGKTRTRNMGCLWSLGRGFLILCTAGLWLLIGRRKETGKTSFKSRTIAICQNCANKWRV